MMPSVPQAPSDLWRSPAACEIADAVWSIHRSYDLVCGIAGAAAGQSLPISRRQLQCNEDRREEHRAIICLPANLTPVVATGDALVVVGPAVASVTRDLSTTGVGLRHDQSLGTKFAVAEFDVFGEPVLLLIEMRWTRQEDELAFSSGGRLVAVVEESRLTLPPM